MAIGNGRLPFNPHSGEAGRFLDRRYARADRKIGQLERVAEYLKKRATRCSTKDFILIPERSQDVDAFDAGPFESTRRRRN
ncbi:MAG: hypothetical protein AAB573_00860 [Patescibacteria group bacterium]